MSMSLTVKNRDEEVMASFSEVEMTMTVLEFKKLFLAQCDRVSKLYPARIRLTVGSPQGKALSDHAQRLSDYIEEPSVTLYFKDLGPQIGWSTVFFVEYAGPIVITLLLMGLRITAWGKDKPLYLNQQLGIAMVLAHYVKRELETAFVHRFSSETMPFTNVFKNSFHYYVIFGFGTMFWFLRPGYEPPSWLTPAILYVFVALFCLFEFLNLMTHLVLRDLRQPGTTERNIPHGWGFGLVSCANYLWETLAWTVFCVQAQTIGGYIYLVVAIVQMTLWALKKHKRYRSEFPNYPRNRKAIFPFLL